MPKKLHTRVLRIALQLPAALAAKRSGGSHRALPRPAHLPAVLRSRKPPPGAEALAESVGASPGSALASLPVQVAPEQASSSPGWDCACGIPRTSRPGENSLLPRLSSSGPTPASRCDGGASCLARGCAACGRLSGMAGSSCLREIGGLIPLRSRGPAASSSWDEDVPLDRGGSSALSNGGCWQFIRRNYAN